MRGKEFTLLTVIVGQNRGIVPSAVRTSLENNVQINATQRIQYTLEKSALRQFIVYPIKTVPPLLFSFQMMVLVETLDSLREK